MGRTKANIDWHKVDNLLKAQCDGTEIAAMLGLKCADTLYRHVKETFKMDFVAYSQQKRAEGRTLLKVAQFDKALTEKDKTMQIWLGKQYLGQKDKNDVTTDGKQIGGLSIVAPTVEDAEIIKRLADANNTADTKDA